MKSRQFLFQLNQKRPIDLHHLVAAAAAAAANAILTATVTVTATVIATTPETGTVEIFAVAAGAVAGIVVGTAAGPRPVGLEVAAGALPVDVSLLYFEQQFQNMVRLASNLPVLVDEFQSRGGVHIYFLSHLHEGTYVPPPHPPRGKGLTETLKDHTSGLNKNWRNGRIYCSEVTRSLLLNKFEGFDPKRVVRSLARSLHSVGRWGYT